jgi:hypothetical protein
MSKKIVLASVMILSAPIFGATNAALAVDCRTSPDLTIKQKWSVETVDGKICWFLGNSATPKEQLRWPGSAKVDSKKAASAAATKQAEPRKPASQPAPEKAKAQKAAVPQDQTKKSASARAAEKEQAKKPASPRATEQDQGKKVSSPRAPEQDQPRKVAAVPAGETIQCRAAPDKSGPGRWSWRTVEGKQCWFLGARDTPREQLQWPAQERVAPSQDDASLNRRPQPPEAEPASPDSSQLVNQESNGDLEFIVPGAWIAGPLSIDVKVGAQFLTHVSITLWPLLSDTPTQYLRTADFALGR